MKEKLERILKKYSMKYRQLHATDDDIIIEESDFVAIATEIHELYQNRLEEIITKSDSYAEAIVKLGRLGI